MDQMQTILRVPDCFLQTEPYVMVQTLAIFLCEQVANGLYVPIFGHNQEMSLSKMMMSTIWVHEFMGQLHDVNIQTLSSDSCFI